MNSIAKSLNLYDVITLKVWYNVRGLFNKFQDSGCILHNNKYIKTRIMLFLNIHLQFNTAFLALNKSREACSIEIFTSTV